MRASGFSVLSFVLVARAHVASAKAGETIVVKITDLAFVPAEVSARVGDTIEWVNADFIDHTATASNGAWDLALPAGSRGRLVVKQAGVLSYFCRVHPNMTGTLNVNEK